MVYYKLSLIKKIYDIVLDIQLIPCCSTCKNLFRVGDIVYPGRGIQCEACGKKSDLPYPARVMLNGTIIWEAGSSELPNPAAGRVVWPDGDKNRALVGIST